MPGIPGDWELKSSAADLLRDAKTGAGTTGKSKLNWAAAAKSLGAAASLGVAAYGVGGEDKCVAGD